MCLHGAGRFAAGLEGREGPGIFPSFEESLSEVGPAHVLRGSAGRGTSSLLDWGGDSALGRAGCPGTGSTRVKSQVVR